MSNAAALQIIKVCFSIFISVIVYATYGQDSSELRYGLQTVNTSEYKQLLKDRRENELVNIQTHVPSLVVDIRYATDNNFMKRRMYSDASAYLVRPAADSLRVIQQQLNKMGYGIKIFDAYRPYDVTVAFYETAKDTTYVASPYSGSRHNRGCAVDLTLIDLRTGWELQMPTGYDDFSRKAGAHFNKLSPRVIKHRRLLQRVMTKHGFNIYPAEWWHFDFAAWKEYPVLNIPFAELVGSSENEKGSFSD